MRVEARAATCTEEGNTEYWKCGGADGCGLCFRDAGGAEWVHEEATVVHALGHDWGEPRYAWADDDAKVTARRVCLRDASHEEEETQKTDRIVYRQPTCTEAGKVVVVSRPFENEGFMRQAKADVDVSELGHDWGAWEVTREPTETRSGAERRVCRRDDAHVQVRVIPPEGHEHTLVRVGAREATCTEDGNTEYWKCDGADDACGLCFRDAAGTEWVHEEATVIHALGHDWGAWEVTKNATKAAEGERMRTCVRCGEVERGAIPAEVSYRYVGDAMQTWTKGAPAPLELTFKRSVEDALTFSLFEGIEVDGRAVPERGVSGSSNYTADRGSLVLRLQPAFLESLAAGEHRMTAFFKDGDASVAFVVRVAEKRDDGKADDDGKTGDGQKGEDEAARDDTVDKSPRLSSLWPVLGMPSATFPLTGTPMRLGNVTRTSGVTTGDGGAASGGAGTGAVADATPGSRDATAVVGPMTNASPGQTAGGVATSAGSVSGTTPTYQVVSPERGTVASQVVGSRASTPGTGDATSVAHLVAMAVAGALAIAAAMAGRGGRRRE